MPRAANGAGAGDGAPLSGASAMRTKAKVGAVAAIAVALSGAPGWGQDAQRLFATPEEAVAALVQAVQDRDPPAVAAIVGPMKPHAKAASSMVPRGALGIGKAGVGVREHIQALDGCRYMHSRKALGT